MDRDYHAHVLAPEVQSRTRVRGAFQGASGIPPLGFGFWMCRACLREVRRFVHCFNSQSPSRGSRRRVRYSKRHANLSCKGDCGSLCFGVLEWVKGSPKPLRRASHRKIYKSRTWKTHCRQQLKSCFVYPSRKISEALSHEVRQKRTADVLPLQHLLGRLRMAQLPARSTGNSKKGGSCSLPPPPLPPSLAYDSESDAFT